ncbi:MAG: MGMT family protein, partial [Acidimicrobiales bacterium]|nr:MGMT family protein [Acidimicrobiales bacterium]
QGSGMTPWEEALDAVLRSLRRGEVVTYGEVAMEAGRPGAARSVGRFLAESGGAYPWWRVVTASGRLVPGHEAEQGRRLEAEGVAVDASRGRVVTPKRSAVAPQSRAGL